MSEIERDPCLVKLVQWNVNLVTPGFETSYPEHEEVIPDCVSLEDFKHGKVAAFARSPEGQALPATAGTDLRVYAKVLRTFRKPPFDFEESQIGALQQIADALPGGRPGRHRVRLPASGCLAGPLDPARSEFGDEFVNFPAFLGQRPAPGETLLSGWVEVRFEPPVGCKAAFELTYHGVGTPVAITWGGGQQYDFLATQIFPTPFLQGIDTVNRGVLDLDTNQVENLAVFATFQGTTIGRTDKVNRIPYAFPYIFPPPPLPEGFQPPPTYQPPPPEVPVFADFSFRLDDDGNIVGLALRSETLAPTGLFPFLPPLPAAGGLFPAFSWGRDYGFHFANPDRCLAGTPSQNCPNDITNGDGILEPPSSYSVYFHPHINLVADGMEAVEKDPTPPVCVPAAVSAATAAAVGDRLYLLGGRTNGESAGNTWIFDRTTHSWTAGPAMPRPVTAAQAAAVGDRIYVLGGCDPAGKVVGHTQVFDTRSGRWLAEEPTPLPTAVAAATATAVGGRIFVISGAETATAKPKLSAAVQILDTATGTWSQGAPASMPVAGAAAVAVGQTIYVINGLVQGASKASHRVNVYEVDSDQWRVGPDTMHGTSGAVACRLGDRLFLVGGREHGDGPTLDSVQELPLDFSGDSGEDPGAWRRSLPSLVPTAESAAAVLGGKLFVAGGLVRTGADAVPGYPTGLVRTFAIGRGWHLCRERPVLTSAGVFNAASLGVGAPELAPGSLALATGFFFADGPVAPPDSVAITLVKGKKQYPATIAWVQSDRILFQVPPELPVDAKGETVMLHLERTGAPSAQPVALALLPSSPGLFFYSFGETREPAFLDNGPALACNGDKSLNFATQPAAPGDRVFLYATGLGKDTKPEAVGVEVGWKKKPATVTALHPLPPLPPQPPVPPFALPPGGVVVVEVELPKAGVEFSNNVPVVLEVGGRTSNRVVVSLRDKASRLSPPVPCEYGFLFVFAPPLPSGPPLG